MDRAFYRLGVLALLGAILGAVVQTSLLVTRDRAPRARDEIKLVEMAHEDFVAFASGLEPLSLAEVLGLEPSDMILTYDDRRLELPLAVAQPYLAQLASEKTAIHLEALRRDGHVRVLILLHKREPSVSSPECPSRPFLPAKAATPRLRQILTVRSRARNMDCTRFV